MDRLTVGLLLIAAVCTGIASVKYARKTMDRVNRLRALGWRQVGHSFWTGPMMIPPPKPIPAPPKLDQ